MNKIFGMHMWRNSFLKFTILLVIFVIVLNAPLLKCLTSVSVNHLLETQNKTKLKTENKIVYSLYMYATLTTLAVV